MSTLSEQIWFSNSLACLVKHRVHQGVPIPQTTLVKMGERIVGGFEVGEDSGGGWNLWE